MHEIQRFTFGTAPITAIDHGGEPALLLAEVAAALQYADPRDARKRLVEHPEAQEGRDYVTITGAAARSILSFAEGGSPSANMVRSTTLVRESGVYLLLMTSRTKVAHAFQGWAARELFPAIRRGEHRTAAPDLRDVATVIASALRDGLQPLAVRVAAVEARLDASSKGSVEAPACPPPHSLRSGQVAAMYGGTTASAVTACASRLRRSYGLFGVRAKSDSWARGETWWYSPAEVALIASTLGLRRADEAGGNVFSLFGGRAG